MSVDETSEKGSPKIVAIIVVVAVVAVVAYVLFGQKHEYTPVVVGGDAIEFSLPDLKGDMTSFSEYRGKVVFLNFWATWCKPCEEEMPSMQHLYETLQKRDFVMVAISVDKEDTDVIQEFVDEYGLTFEVLHDRKGRIKEAYKTTGVPETYIIDQNGVIAEKVMGARKWENAYAIKTILDLMDNGPRTPDAYRSKKSRPAKKY